MQVTICGIEFNIDYKYQGKKINHNFGDNAYHNYYTITLQRGKDFIIFDFYDSIFNTEKGIKSLDNNKLLHAFNCFLMDCIVYYDFENFADFMEEFGYDNPHQAEKVFNGCHNNYIKCMEIMTEKEMCDINSYFSDNGY